jgi:hypothetical protein
MFDRFSHYLTYGATDQQTVRELRDFYDGLIVPGTVAAFQREGTGGFVLSLSATPEGPPYLIDPRFPLFQKANASPKKSHEALADLFEEPSLIRDLDPSPEDFPPEVLAQIAKTWVEFNTSYESRQAAKFKKYASRLDEDVDEDDAKAPTAIVAPYFVSAGDEWWSLTSDLLEETRNAAPSDMAVLSVTACATPTELDRRLAEGDDEKTLIWVSGLEELGPDSGALLSYGEAIRDANSRGQLCFALYGGFFAVLLGAVGLRGACHGIGYGEHRNWPELQQSGPPPARYYAPRFHRYIGQDLAYQLWSLDADLTACHCTICEGGPPLLDYHDLMKHSVLARQAEIDRWSSLDLPDTLSLLERETDELEDDLAAAGLPAPLVGPAERSMRHLGNWIGVLRRLAGLGA